MVPPASDVEPNPPCGYVVSFIRLHERGFTALASRFMRGLCYHYGVELHNFAPNAISQAGTFVGICEGFLRIPVNLDLWVHLFCVELHTLTMGESRVRRAVRAGGLTFALWDSPLHRQGGLGERVVLPPQQWHRPPPYTGKVLMAKIDAWHHGVSPSSRQQRLESLIDEL
jgi:hypothetical protein